MLGRCDDTVLWPLTGQRSQLVGSGHTLVAWGRGLWPRRLRLVLYEERKLDYGPQIVVAIDAGFVELAVQVVLQATDYNVRIHGEDRDKRRVRIHTVAASEQHVDLEKSPQ